MHVEHIQFRQFRNIRDEYVELHSGLNVFQGPNGQGKTNFVEGVYLLSHGRSFRTSENSALVQHGENQRTRIVAKLVKQALNHELDFQIVAGKKKIKANGKSVSGAYLRKNFPTVLFSPESLLIIKQSPQHRRSLVDDLALGVLPSFAQVYEDCGRLLKQKNAFLREVKTDKTGDSRETQRLFNSLTDLFFAKGARLVVQRLKVMKAILPFLQKEFAAIMGDSLVELEMDYLISGKSALEMSEEQIINALYKRWAELSQSEKALGQTLVGPHKHDVQFRFNGQEARLFCSQGQQRAIILAFKMAHIGLHCAAHGMYPMLLLDDVLSELDKIKQERFLEALIQTQSQILMTATDASKVPTGMSHDIYNVNVGTFTKVQQRKLGEMSV